MGDPGRYAERMALIDLVPRGDLSTTGYALANPGSEYLGLQPSETGDAFDVELAAGSYAVEWYDVASRETKAGAALGVEKDGRVNVKSPFAKAGASVLYLEVT